MNIFNLNIINKLVVALFLASCILASCVKKLEVNPDKSISLTLDTVRVTVGSSAQLASKNYAGTELLWNSADTSVVSVSPTGLAEAKKAGQSVINVKTKDNAVSATCLVIVIPKIVPINAVQVPGKGTDIGIGADGSVFVVGTEITSPITGGYSISKLVGSSLVKLPDCAAIRIAVSPTGVPWVVNKSNLIYRYNGTTWDVLPGMATDIGIGADGSVFIIGTKDVSPTGGFNILKWNGSDWTVLPDCSGIRIAVNPAGIPWVVNKSNIVYRNTGGVLWEAVPGVAGGDIGIGADGSVYVTGKDSTSAAYQPPIYKFISGGWSLIPGISGTNIAVSPTGLPWWIDKANNIYKQN